MTGTGHATGHIAPKGMYFAIFAALMLLTTMTVAVTYLDLGPFNMIVAMGIAVTKATLVILYFMHIRWSGRLNQVTLLSALLFLGFLFAFTLGDYLSRGTIGVFGR